MRELLSSFSDEINQVWFNSREVTSALSEDSAVSCLLLFSELLFYRTYACVRVHFLRNIELSLLVFLFNLFFNLFIVRVISFSVRL
jgi:hypothetical protein